MTSLTLSSTRQIYKSNLNFTDRQIRYVVGAALLAIPLLVQPETMGLWTIMILSSIPVITTAILGWDPLYAVLGKTTYVEGEEEIQQRSWTCPNIGILDRAIRLTIGGVLLASLLTLNTMSTEMVIALLSIPLIVSAITAWDPIYAALGSNSFASRGDVTAAEPEASDQTIAACYEFPQSKAKKQYSQAA